MKNLLNYAILIVVQVTTILGDCKYPTQQGSHPAKVKIAPLIGHSWSANDESGEFAYTVGICTTAMKGEPDLLTAGAVQVKTATKEKVIIGDFEHSYIKGGEKWVYLEYKNETIGGPRCSAQIMLLCDAEAKEGSLKVLEENSNLTQDCYFLFEFSHSVLCSVGTGGSGLSSGTIFCIIFLTVVGLYLLVGFVYQRLVVGAKGWEQIPNHAFWQDFGNLQADGCEFICRSRSKSASRGYRGIGDDQLQDDEFVRDDSLLPM